MKKELRILIVDDENINITVLMDILESEYIVQVAKNGIKALEIAKKSPTDLILLDIVMPEMDGYEVCNKLKLNSDTQNIPIIFITSKSEHEDEVKGLRLGAVDYITKPFNSTVVQTRVKTQLDLKLYGEQMEKLVAERTRQLEIKSKNLEIKSKDLEEANIALRVLVDNTQEAIKENEKELNNNIKELIMPLFTKIKLDQRPSSQKAYLDIIESSLNKIINPFSVDITCKLYKFTPTEMQIANMTREGKTTKEIANLLGIASRTVTWHRDNIRKKLDIKHKKINLRNYLLTM